MAIVASIFGEYAEAQNLQAMIDNSSEVLYGQAFWRNYLDWGLPQTSLTFETVIGRSRIEAAASIVNPDDPAPLRSRSNWESYKGAISTMKEKFSLSQKEYRDLKAIQSLPISDAAKKEALMKILYDDIMRASKSTDIRNDILFAQALSKLEIDINVTNNPDGAVFGTIDLLAGSHQKRNVAKAWGTDVTADIVKDIQDAVADARLRGISFEKILIDESMVSHILSNTTLKSQISGYYNPGSNAKFIFTLDTVNELLGKYRLPYFEPLNLRKGVEKDGVITVINPFKVENAVLVPAGKLGVMHNAIAIEEWEAVPGISYSRYDRALLSKWRDNDPWREYTQVELNAFPGLERIESIYILKTDTVA